jgi:outer membrane protein assembly factor BamB
VDHGIVIVGAQGAVVAFDARDGASLWSTESCYSWPAVVSAAGGRILVSTDASVSSLDQRTGVSSWTVSPGLYTLPTAMGDGLVVVSSVYSLATTAVDAGSGAIVWAKDFVADGGAMAKGVLYVTNTTDARVDALDEQTGDVLWSTPVLPSSPDATPTVVASSLYFATEDGTFYAVDVQTHRIRWTVVLDGGLSPGEISLAYGRVFALHGGAARAMDERTGATLWDVQLGTGSPRSMAVAGGVVYAAGWDHHVWALDATSGAILWDTVDAQSVVGGVSVWDGTLYVSDWLGAVRAYRLP